MTFPERYNQATIWFEKVLVMEIYHLAMTHREKGWTITKTADAFSVSIGLVSENLRLAQAIHTNDKVAKCESRQDALRRLNS